jgi:dTDP-4-amino-4,6-dideoxygalactose transaminase
MHLYVIECDRRDELMEYLRSHKIGASLHYPLAVHQHTAFAQRIGGWDDLPVTDQFYKRNITLPMYPELSNNAVQRVIDAIRDFFQD